MKVDCLPLKTQSSVC